ncbi:MAG: FGGY-family carbohydrate kinase [Gammaproteobacteria bacterium]
MQTQNKHHYLGIDFGTTGCRAIVINSSKQIVANAKVLYPASAIANNPKNPKHHEQDPQLWWNSFKELISQLERITDLRVIKRLSLDATSGTILLADQNGQPMSPALMYNDARAESEATEIRQLEPANAALHSSSSGIAKMLWLKRHYQPVTTTQYLHQADWIIGQLSGNYSITDYNNALKSGIDLETKQWPSWIEQLDIKRHQLANITAPGTTVGLIKKTLATELGFSSQLEIRTGCTDSTAAVIATGATNIGDAVSSLGSTLVVKIISDKALFNSEFGIYSQPFKGNFLVGGGSNSGGVVLKHFFTIAQMQQMSNKIDLSTTTGVNYYPLLHDGERFPFNDANYPARLSPRPEDDIEFFKGLLEGITEIEHLCYQRLQEMGCPEVKQIFSMGGGSHNPVWTQMRQARLNIPIITPDNSEAAYGAALIAHQH